MPTWHCTRKQASKTKQLDATTKASRIFINPEAATKMPGNVNITYDTQKRKERIIMKIINRATEHNHCLG